MSAQSIVMCVALELVLTIQMGNSTCVNVKMEQCLEPTQTTFLHALVGINYSYHVVMHVSGLKLVEVCFTYENI